MARVELMRLPSWTGLRCLTGIIQSIRRPFAEKPRVRESPVDEARYDVN